MKKGPSINADGREVYPVGADVEVDIPPGIIPNTTTLENHVMLSVVRKSAAPARIVSIYAGTPDEVSRKWRDITWDAFTYKYAEYSEGLPVLHFPYSIWEMNGNNSNTFVTTLMSENGLSGSLSGRHWGNSIANDSSLGRWKDWRVTKFPA